MKTLPRGVGGGTILSPLLEYASRTRSEFHKFDAMSMVETLQNRAHDTVI